MCTMQMVAKPPWRMPWMLSHLAVCVAPCLHACSDQDGPTPAVPAEATLAQRWLAAKQSAMNLRHQKIENLCDVSLGA